jgi:hypothetical protein
MFFLTASELDAARDAIAHHGYSTLLPEPPEWGTVLSNWSAIRESIEKLDLDIYTPFTPMRVFAPKNRANLRVLHLLHPQDLLIYTALVLIVKDDIEASRIPTRAKRVFSFRASKQPNHLYDSRHAYERYREQLEKKSAAKSVRFVALADIADFYSRIYQHRLENVLESVAKTQRTRDVARVLVRKLVGSIMGRDSYGIPIGPYASRVLAEGLLIDVDAALLAQGIDFVRWVDDYNIFCKSEHDAQAALFTLGEWLFSKHGLTLQSAKTKILPLDSYRTDVLSSHDHRLTGRDEVVGALRDFHVGYESEDEEEPSEAEIDRVLAVINGANLRAMLDAAVSDTALVDYEAVTYVLTRLPRIPGVSSELRQDVLRLVIDHSPLLYPVAEQIAKYVLSFSDLSTTTRKRVAAKLLKPLLSRQKPPPYYAMWVLHIFASSAEWNHTTELTAIYTAATSEVAKRYAALAAFTSGTRATALAIKDDYVAASPLLRLAILAAVRRLGEDERKHWKLANSVSGVLEKAL